MVARTWPETTEQSGECARRVNARGAHYHRQHRQQSELAPAHRLLLPPSSVLRRLDRDSLHSMFAWSCLALIAWPFRGFGCRCGNSNGWREGGRGSRWALSRIRPLWLWMWLWLRQCVCGCGFRCGCGRLYSFHAKKNGELFILIQGRETLIICYTERTKAHSRLWIKIENDASDMQLDLL